MTDGTLFKRDGYAVNEGDILIEDGRMMRMKDGKMVPLKEKPSAKDGAKVMQDINVILNGDARMMMREGDRITLDNNMIKYDTRQESKRMMENKEVKP